MNARLLTIGFCIIFSGIYWGYSQIIAHFAERRTELRAHHEKLARAKESEWRAQSELLQQELVQKRNDLARQQQQDLAEAFGGPMQAIMNDPRLTLPQMIRAVAAQASPAGTRVQVRVDRFIDFQLHLDLPANADQISISQLTTDILKETSDYLSSLIIVRQSEIIGELTRDEIQSVFNWNSANPEIVAKLLHNEDEQPAFDTTRNTNLPNAAFALPHDRAKTAFSQLIDEALDSIKKAVDLQNTALNLKGLRTKDFSARRKQLNEAGILLRTGAVTLQEPANAYEKILRAEGLPNSDIDPIITTFRKTEPPTRNLRRVLDLFQSRAAAGLELFNILDRHAQGWDPDATGDYITFNSETVSEQVRAQQRLLAEETIALEKALSQWANQPPPRTAEKDGD